MIGESVASNTLEHCDEARLAAGRRAVVEAGRRMISDGLVEGTAGNISVRVGDVVAISPSSVAYDKVSEDQVCIVDMSGVLLGDTHFPPSSETAMHLAIYQQSDARAVVHHHGLQSVTVSTVVDELPPLHYYAVRLGGPTRVARYATYGTAELARSVVAALADRTAALMQNHGAVAYGSTLEEAYDRAGLLEWLCTLYVNARSIGQPRILSDAELDDVIRARVAK
jgi:L-fuculose-phosphate aldolase